MIGLRTWVWLLSLAGVAGLAAGCDTLPDKSCTGSLWNNTPVEHYEPAPRREVKMFQQRGGEDTLVEYIEQREKTGATKPRAYYMLANENRIERMKKPRFVRLESARGLAEIPVQRSPVMDISLAEPVWAELTPEADGFRLIRNGMATDWYHFPVYLDKRDEAERILLTPVAVTADAAVVGAVVGVVGLVLYAEGDWCCDDHHDSHGRSGHH